MASVDDVPSLPSVRVYEYADCLDRSPEPHEIDWFLVMVIINKQMLDLAWETRCN